MKKEQWKIIKIKGYKTNYLISNYGRVRNINTNKILKPKKERNGYIRYGLCFNGKRYFMSAHRLVAIAFLGKPLLYKTKQVNHIDGNKLNNYVGNLEWVYNYQNMHHAYENNLMNVYKISGRNNYNAKFSEDLIKKICKLLHKGVRNKDIRKKLKLENNKSINSLIEEIKSRKRWKSISKYYKW